MIDCRQQGQFFRGAKLRALKNPTMTPPHPLPGQLMSRRESPGDVAQQRYCKRGDWGAFQKQRFVSQSFIFPFLSCPPPVVLRVAVLWGRHCQEVFNHCCLGSLCGFNLFQLLRLTFVFCLRTTYRFSTFRYIDVLSNMRLPFGIENEGSLCASLL